MKFRISFFSLLALTLSHSAAVAGKSRVYFGTYTKAGESQGIYHASFDDATGKLGEVVLAAEMKNPSFLAIAPSGKTLYAVSEVADVNGEGQVSAFRILESGKLQLINQVRSGGGGPCFVSLTPDGKTLAVANYGGGSVASYRIAEDGALSAPVSVIHHTGSSVDSNRQKEPHAHSINFSPDGRFAYAADLGTDRVYRYAVDPVTGALSASGETVITPGSGPRHFAFRPDGAFAYVISEMTLMMTAFRIDKASGELREVQSLSTLPPGSEKIGSTAEVVAHPSGRFLYGSNRGHDSIVAYAIDGVGGQLRYLENEPIRGKVPRNFIVSPSGKWLLAAGQQSGTVTVFAIDDASGELTYADSEAKVSSPVCIRFVPAYE
jgi:6-phosphogluconolactonase